MITVITELMVASTGYEINVVPETRIIISISRLYSRLIGTRNLRQISRRGRDTRRSDRDHFAQKSTNIAAILFADSGIPGATSRLLLLLLLLLLGRRRRSAVSPTVLDSTGSCELSRGKKGPRLINRAGYRAGPKGPGARLGPLRKIKYAHGE